jgi:hypothetical protein
MANSVPPANALDLALINWAYGSAPLPQGYTVLQTINEPGPNQTLQIRE